MNRTWTRRQYLGGLAAAVPAAAFASNSGAALARGTTSLAFADAQAALEALVRVMGDSRGVQAPWWYTGTIVGIRPGEEPKPLVRFEGAEINLFVPERDGSFRQTGLTTTFYQDLTTGAVLENFVNPYTGQTNTVRPNKLGGTGSYVVWKAESVQPFFTGLPPAAPVPLHVHWTQHRDLVWMRHDRVYPPGMPQPSFEASTSVVRRKELLNPRLTSCPAQFSSTYIAPWPRWMEMGSAPGHVIWHADGVKLPDVSAFPKDYLERVQRLYPEQLTVKMPPVR